MNGIKDIKWALILNPHAGASKGRKDKQKIEKLLIAQGFQYKLLISEYAKHAISLTKQIIESGARNLIVVGGDGTLNEVVNGIFLQEDCLPEEITVGMIPVGTGNDWIKTFGIPNDYQSAII